MYLLVRTRDYSTRNKLQKAAWEYLKEQNRTVYFDGEAVKTAINDFRNQIVRLNNEHYRCSGLELHSFESGEDDITVYVTDVIYLTFYKSK
jgi:hypothetical protein